MKTGRSLIEIARELDRQFNNKRDYLANTAAIEVKVQDGKPAIHGLNGTDYGIGEVANRQISERLGIPFVYYNRLREASPALLADNINYWLKKNPERRLIRTLDGKARAFLSDRFRPIDNFDLAESVLPIISAAGCRIESAEITEKKFYIKAVSEKVTGEVRKGDVVQAGIVVSNSEVGFGTVSVSPLIFRLVCLNGLIVTDSALRKYHVGKISDAFGLGDDTEGGKGAIEYKSDTVAAGNKAFFLKARDVVSGVLDAAVFGKFVDRLRATTSREMEASPVAVVETVRDRFDLSEKEGDSVLNHLIKGGDLSQYGLLNAITRASQDVEDYDRATEFEALGGRIMDITAQDWMSIATIPE